MDCSRISKKFEIFHRLAWKIHKSATFSLYVAQNRAGWGQEGKRPRAAAIRNRQGAAGGEGGVERLAMR